ncbi:DUF4365 domain-containing protein [Kitasatospora sp. CM 4170]|uniref:DUF4365 domain-containing protein n=1 Tax=Kitasatospora aburaviensis TaxID=67265 RepID=A0ABW1F297_9ACTN|nr:DUF4365 domain-containing protein [Kitasatospora sp. CM 4170]WNM47358.1 DUF4365 domain-containing protein [Kitasatospora sp. CM 4170]
MTVPLPRVEPDLSSVVTLSQNGAKGRYGVSYVRSIVSQAGVGFTETSPDEDVLAVDATVDFALAPARIQIKCSAGFSIAGKSATWQSELYWREQWSQSLLPVYFVLVILDVDDRHHWINHHDAGTDHRAAAFWVRVNQSEIGDKIRIPKSQRLTADVLRLWHQEVEACFSPAA